MALGGAGHRGGQLRCWLAVCFAVLLAVVPSLRPALPVAPVVAAAAVEDFVARDALEKPPAPGLMPAQPLALGVLARLVALEAKLGPPPLKPLLLRSRAERPRPALQAAVVFAGEPAGSFQRSAVGTARTPTGPPA